MNQVIVCGGCGKMASLAATHIFQDQNLKLAGIIEASGHSALGKDWGIFTGIGEVNVKIEADLGIMIDQGDIVVDFTNPEASLEHLAICLKHKKAMVIGTTGFSNIQLKQIENASRIIPVVLSPNMSLGVNLLFELVKKVSGILDDQYDIEIIETHHRYKKDAPSGTAKKIAEIIALEKHIDLEKMAVYGRSGYVGQRKKGEIGIHAIRAGNINGEHMIIFNSSGERLELTHKAYGREAFAQGTVKAIHFLLNQQKGLFSMKEVLGL
jgi:4-hydroxy-tetrahydrodipicolinate reductase